MLVSYASLKLLARLRAVIVMVSKIVSRFLPPINSRFRTLSGDFPNALGDKVDAQERCKPIKRRKANLTQELKTTHGNDPHSNSNLFG